MPITSPFDGLSVDRELVCEFFAAFARFEFALKELHIVRAARDVAEPAWRTFSSNAAKTLKVTSASALDEAIQYLVSKPPQVQFVEGWRPQALHGQTDVEKAIDAACRVRNNLFHGGKHTPLSPPGRDQKLVESALTLLTACIEQDQNLRDTYEQNAF